MVAAADGESMALAVGVILGLAGLGVSVYPALLPEGMRRPVALSCLAGAAAIFLWLLWLFSTVLAAAIVVVSLLYLGGRAFVRRRRRKDAVAQPATVQAAAHLHAAVAVQATARVASPWSTGASESPVLHEMYPATTGVLLWCRHRDGVPQGTYLCEVTFEGRVGAAKTLVPKGDGRLDCIYPRDFEGAPPLPLKDGRYKIEWFTDVGVGRTTIALDEFERRGGHLVRPWD